MQYKAGPQGQVYKLVQMSESQIDKCMEIQAACFEPHHCEDKQSYLDRMALYPEGMVVLMVTSPEDHTQWEIAGYVLFQPFFRGEIYYDGNTEKLKHAIASNRDAHRDAERQVNCFYLHELSVSPKFRGKGLTAPLTSYVEEAAIAHDFHTVSLVSLPAPHGFWKKCGYITVSDIDYEGSACYYMEKQLARLP